MSQTPAKKRKRQAQPQTPSSPLAQRMTAAAPPTYMTEHDLSNEDCSKLSEAYTQLDHNIKTYVDKFGTDVLAATFQAYLEASFPQQTKVEKPTGENEEEHVASKLSTTRKATVEEVDEDTEQGEAFAPPEHTPKTKAKTVTPIKDTSGRSFTELADDIGDVLDYTKASETAIIGRPKRKKQKSGKQGDA